MRIVGFSDSHSYHNKLVIPDGDVLICAGDITFSGEIPIVASFCDWMKEQPHKHKICIAGNHEVGIERGYKRQPFLEAMRRANIIYLENDIAEIDGINFYGSPITPAFMGWEFNRHRGKDIADVWSKIPESTDILITHGPPYGILDKAPRGAGTYSNEGCQDLLDRVWELPKLKAHFFGHIHRDNNEAPEEIADVKFCNVSILNNAYNIHNDPVVIEI